VRRSSVSRASRVSEINMPGDDCAGPAGGCGRWGTEGVAGRAGCAGWRASDAAAVVRRARTRAKSFMFLITF
jgi:hypothetical protein